MFPKGRSLGPISGTDGADRKKYLRSPDREGRGGPVGNQGCNLKHGQAFSQTRQEFLGLLSSVATHGNSISSIF